MSFYIRETKRANTESNVALGQFILFFLGLGRVNLMEI